VLSDEIESIFTEYEKIDLNMYIRIVKDINSDMFMMIFYCLRKITKILDDSMVRPKAFSLSPPKKDSSIASPKLVSVRFFSPKLRMPIDKEKFFSNDLIINLKPIAKNNSFYQRIPQGRRKSIAKTLKVVTEFSEELHKFTIKTCNENEGAEKNEEEMKFKRKSAKNKTSFVKNKLKPLNLLESPDIKIYSKKYFYTNILQKTDLSDLLTIYADYLYKFNSTEIKKYWFVMRNFKLIYYNDKDKQETSGMINLIKCFLKKDGPVTIMNKNYFRFHIYHNLNQESFLCDDENKYNLWVKYLNNFCESRETIENYNICEIIGKGKFSKVHLAIKKNNNEKVAIKILNKKEMLVSDLESTRRELSILQICNHEHIIKIKSYIENFEYIYIIMEYFPSIDLFDHFLNNKFSLDEKTVKQVVIQLVTALEYLHNLGIVHRDIKPENIIIKQDDLNVKIIDFNFSRFLANNEYVDEPLGTLVCIYNTSLTLHRRLCLRRSMIKQLIYIVSV
jgi:tRNA A-37 threonylcarbamoyl transferase component Bud32